MEGERSHRRANAQIVCGNGMFHEVGVIPKSAHDSWLGWQGVGTMTPRRRGPKRELRRPAGHEEVPKFGRTLPPPLTGRYLNHPTSIATSRPVPILSLSEPPESP